MTRTMTAAILDHDGIATLMLDRSAGLVGKRSRPYRHMSASVTLTMRMRGRSGSSSCQKTRPVFAKSMAPTRTLGLVATASAPSDECRRSYRRGHDVPLSSAKRAKADIGPAFSRCLLLALFGHPTCTDECPLSGVKQT
jgi:hypothetical protein